MTARAAPSAAALAGAVFAALLLLLPRGESLVAIADGWRALFLLVSAAPLGAVALLLVARVVGADWDAALAPLLPAVPWLFALVLPVAAGQALHPAPAHLRLWLAVPFVLARSVAALAFWSWLAARLARGRVPQPGPMLLLHGVAVSVMGYDWLLGVSPAHGQSAAAWVLATMQIGGACAAACLLGLGEPRQRRDLARLLVAAALGLAYLLYVDFVIVWFGNLPEHVDWYVDRRSAPGPLLPPLALALGLAAPVLLVASGRDGRTTGAAALAGLALTCLWFVAGDRGWIAAAVLLAGVALLGVPGVALRRRREAVR